MNNFQSNPKLKNLDPLKLKLVIQIMEGSKGKSAEEMLPQILKINSELKKRNMEFTKNESHLLIDVLMENMTPSEKKKFMMIKAFLNNSGF